MDLDYFSYGERMVPLTFVTEEEVARSSTTISVLLYGPPGVGKSVGAASAPDPILYLNADRPSALRYARHKYPNKDFREVKVTGRDSIEKAYIYARDDSNGIRTVAWDSLGRIYDLVLTDFAKDDKHPTLPERGDANKFIEKHILGLLELPVHVVLVAHDNPVIVAGNEDEGSASHELFPFTGVSNATMAKKIMRSVDIVGYCGRIEGESDEKPRYVAQVFMAGGRHGKDTTGIELGGSDGIVDLDLSGWARLVAAAFGANGNSKQEEK